MGGFAPVRPRLRDRILDDPQAPQLDGQFAAPYAPMEPPQEPSAPPVRMGDVFGAGALSGMTGRSAMSSAVPMDRPMTLKERIIAGLGGFAGGAARGALNPPRVFTGRSWEADPYQLQAQRMGGEYGLQAQRLGAEERMMGERLGVESELSKQRLAELIAAQQMRGQTATDVAGIRAGGQIGAAQERAAGTLGAAEMRRETSLAEIAARERMNSATNAIRSEANRIRSQGTQGKLAPTEQRMKDISIATLPRVDALIDETQNVSDMLGPLTGRWNDLWTGKIGAPNPRFAHYMNEMRFLDTAITLAHSQGRVSNIIYENFKQMLDAGYQSPENMLQALIVSREWLQTYAQFGTPGFGQAPTTPSTPSAPTASGNTVTLDQFLKER